jgi:DNA-directed RNA polymerase specialized sigma24 family protein
MSKVPASDNLDVLLAQSDWLRRLALGLVHSRSDADDLIQETWMAALRSPPDPERPIRPWLTRVLQNLSRMSFRGESRRRLRDQSAAVGEGTEAVDDVLQRMQMHRQVAEMVVARDEPYRPVLLGRF